jgi:O-antigen ligase
MITPLENKLHVQALQDSVVTEIETIRFSIWYDYLQIVKEYPVCGIGYGMQSYNKDFFINNNFKLPNFAS